MLQQLIDQSDRVKVGALAPTLRLVYIYIYSSVLLCNKLLKCHQKGSPSIKKRGNKQSTGRATHNQNIGFGAGPTFDTHPVNQKETAIQYRQKTFSVGFRDKNNNRSASEELRYSNLH